MRAPGPFMLPSPNVSMTAARAIVAPSDQQASANRRPCESLRMAQPDVGKNPPSWVESHAGRPHGGFPGPRLLDPRVRRRPGGMPDGATLQREHDRVERGGGGPAFPGGYDLRHGVPLRYDQHTGSAPPVRCTTLPVRMEWLGPAQVGAVKAATAAAGALLLGAGALRSARGRAPGRSFDALLAALGLLAAACWWNLGRFHYPGFGHASETYHYYVGGKYFPELGYTGLYRCTALADAEAGRRAEVEARYARDLGTNRIVPAAELLRDPALCKARFSPERWRSFRRDVRHFRERLPVERWQRTQVDHGYNATPAWGLVGRLLASTGPATDGQILLLRLLDPLLLAGTGLAIACAFGWRTLCVALLYFGTNYPALYGWVGGAYLRQLDLALLLIGICCLRRDRPAMAGALFAAATLVRVYPATAFAGVALRAGWEAVAARRLVLSRFHRRFALSALATLAILVPLSGVAAGGLGAWSAFFEHGRVLLDTPLRNHAGLRTFLAYDPAAPARTLLDPKLDDPYAPWKEARIRSFAARRPLFLASLAIFALLLAAATHRAEDWSAAVLALGLVPIALELTSYYWAVLAAYALLRQRSRWVGAALCALSASGWWIADRWIYYDETLPRISLATAVFVVLAR